MNAENTKKIFPRRKEVVSLVSMCCPCVRIEFLCIGFLSSFHDCWLLDSSKSINSGKKNVICVTVENIMHLGLNS